MGEPKKLSGKEKALVFLSSLGDDVSAKVLRCLPDKISSKITDELNKFSKPAPDLVAYVFRELSKFALSFVSKPKLTGVVESEATTEHLDSLSQLGRKTPQELLALLQNEQPQTIAFVLNYLSKTMQEKFYNLLSPGKRNEIKKLNIEKVAVADKVFEKLNEKLLVLDAQAR